MEFDRSLYTRAKITEEQLFVSKLELSAARSWYAYAESKMNQDDRVSSRRLDRAGEKARAVNQATASPMVLPYGTTSAHGE